LSSGKKKLARKKKNVTEQFEEAALAKLGGSICFVMKKNKFLWKGEED
jgi:hypothetical protein